MRIGRYKLWYRRKKHFCGFYGKVGRPKQVEPIFGFVIGGFRSYYFWRFWLTIFENNP